MLVYANSFNLSGTGTVDAVIEQVCIWISKKYSSRVDAGKIAIGVRELRFSEGATLSSRSTVDDDSSRVYPFYFCARLTHGQDGVPGRRWITEVGLRQDQQEADIHCSVLTKTEEISTQVNSPIQATRPTIVRDLFLNCKPSQDAIGIAIKTLDEESATAFGYEIDRFNRRHPIVLVSADKDGRYSVDSNRLSSLLVGLAQVVKIATTADTFLIEKILGRRNSAFGGAINIIFPARGRSGERVVLSKIYRPESILEAIESGINFETEILSAITHQTNLPHSWKHISLDTVAEELLRIRLREASSKVNDGADLAIYDELLHEAADQIAKKGQTIDSLQQDVEDLNMQLGQANLQFSDLQSAFSEAARYKVTTPSVDGEISKLRRQVSDFLRCEDSVERSLEMVSTLYSDRIVVLPSARSSAQASDKGGFKYPKKAQDILLKLVGEYWESLVVGDSDQKARQIFGNKNFAARESDTLSNDGKKRRTFTYQEREVLMERHIKIGVADNLADTFRVHFEWFPLERLIVVGHCGGHLDF